MPIPSIPPVLPMPIANGGDTRDIPDQTPTGTNQLSFQSGFPSITSSPLAAGGIPPQREDFNSAYKLLSQHTFFQQSGSIYPWEASLNYLRGAHVIGNDGKEYVSRAPSGPETPASAGGFVGPKIPDGDNGVYWILAQFTALSSDLTVYLRTTGSDSNNGLSAVTALRSFIGAFSLINSLNVRGFSVTLDVGEGTWHDVVLPTTLVGVSTLNIIGAGSATVFSTSGTSFSLPSCAYTTVFSNLRITGAGYYGIRFFNCSVIIGPGVIFGALTGANGAHISSENGASLIIASPYTINGGAGTHYNVAGASSMFVGTSGGVKTITVSGSPAFTTFATSYNASVISTNAILAFSGAASGRRYSATVVSAINTSGGGANLFPGSIAGEVGTGGIYV